MKRLPSVKLYEILALVMLVELLIISPTISSLINSIIIRSTGRIATAPRGLHTLSEIRGVFVHCASFDDIVDWDIVAQTCKDYKIDRIYSEMLSVRNTYYPSAYRPNAAVGGRDELGLAIAACHSRGLQFHVAMDVVYVPKDDQPELRAVDYNGNQYPWSCASNPAYRTLVKNLVEELVTKYDVDGFMFDYIRWEDTEDICYCSYCKEKFQAWLGETITDWTPFYPGGSRQNEFLEWRNVPITEVVELIYNSIKAIKPDIEISLAAWTYFEDCPTYWRKYIGQDTGDWIRKDYLDLVAPMMYTSSLTELQDFVNTNWKYMVAGPEGKIPMVGFLDVERKNTPSTFKQQIDWLRSVGVDGWILWRYGGPGVSAPSNDIRNYLNAIDSLDAFAMSNIQVSTAETQATIIWTTNLPANSRVEYSTSSLFPAYLRTWGDFNYWDIDHSLGTIIENLTLVTNHCIVLTGLTSRTKYYFRVQSQDASGTTTSKVLTFTTL